jgi:YidC/Oxa1 family membrane protein insertase
VENQRNVIIAAVLCVLIFFGWEAAMQHFYPQPEHPKPAATATESAGATAGGGATAPASEETNRARPTREGGLTGGELALERRDLKQDLASGDRVPVDAPGLAGSINLKGALVDDLVTKRHRQTVKKSSGPERIFSPPGTPAQQSASFGWTAPAMGADAVELPGPKTLWSAPAGARLTPASPVTLTWTNPTGQIFAITYSIDKDYMITAKQSVINHGAAPVMLQPIAQIARTDATASVDGYEIHSGPFGAFDEAVQFGPNYKDVREEGTVENEGSTDWVGFTDVYWMSTLIPGPGAVRSDFRALGDHIYLADLFYPKKTVAAGAQSSHVTRLFAGAKESEVLDRYQSMGIPKFGLAIDWGWFRWFEKPIFWLLKKLFWLTGNFGVAIILLTLIVRGMMFPIAHRQFASMAAMKAIQPKMKAIQERYKDDKQKAQQEVMALYKKEGVNPLAGCLPMFLQVPVFFALYKVLLLSIEMRHQPFVLWIRDLSAPDPLHIFNLFGLLPFAPSGFLAIGPLALLLGITMYFQFRLNPAQMDPMQQQMFKFMPWVMMFIMAPFAAGLLVYWITSNLLTMSQQQYLYSRHPQLRAQAAKDSADAKRTREREDSARAGK